MDILPNSINVVEAIILDLMIEDPVWGYRALELFWKNVQWRPKDGMEAA